MEEDVNELEEDVRRHQCVQKITKRKKYLRMVGNRETVLGHCIVHHRTVCL